MLDVGSDVVCVLKWEAWRPQRMVGWERRAVWSIGEHFTDEETDSERLSNCLGSHSNQRKQLSVEELRILTLSSGLALLGPLSLPAGSPWVKMR